MLIADLVVGINITIVCSIESVSSLSPQRDVKMMLIREPRDIVPGAKLFWDNRVLDSCMPCTTSKANVVTSTSMLSS